MAGLFEELKRRNVVRVGVAYVVVMWLILQFSDLVLENMGAPDWVMQGIMLLLAIGLPIALIFAWAFELTPEGLKTTKEVDQSKSVTHNTGRKLDRLIIAVLAIAVVYFIWERQQPADAPVEMPENVADSQVAENVPGSPDAQPIRRSIAVLPFVNMSSDQDQEWFADGLTEEILNALARTPDLLVAARTSSFAYKDSNDNIPTIAESLGVDHILEGSVRRSNDRLRVTVQLIRASDGFHLWSENYDRTLDDVIVIQEEIAIEIARALKTAMDPESLARMVSSGTSSVSAYEAYLQGLTYGVSTIASGDSYQFLDARDAYEKAVQLDPEFALAYWGIARFWRLQLVTVNIVSGLTDLSAEEISSRYIDAVDKAIAFAPDPVTQLGYRAQKAHAELKLLQALRLNTEYLAERPYDGEAQRQQLVLFSELRRYDEAAETVADYFTAEAYDPVVAIRSILMLLYVDDPVRLRSFANSMVERFDNNINVLYQAHRALLWAGDIDGASRILPTIQSSDLPEWNLHVAKLRQLCAEGKTLEAERHYVHGLSQYADRGSTTWLAHLIMGNKEDAIATLMPLDNDENMTSLASYLRYGAFDPRSFPNLMARLESQGVEPGKVVEIPYQCGG